MGWRTVLVVLASIWLAWLWTAVATADGPTADRDLRRREVFSNLEAAPDSPSEPRSSTDPVLLKGRIVPVACSPTTTSDPPATTIVTADPRPSTVGVRLNTVGTGTLVSLIDPTGPLPGSLEVAFAKVSGDWKLRTRRAVHPRVVARGVEFDVAWGNFDPDPFDTEATSADLESVTIPADSPLRRLPDNHLLVKVPGKAVFVVFAEDFAATGVPVRSVRVLVDGFDHPSGGFGLLDDGSLDPLTDHPPDSTSHDLAAGDGVYTRVLTGLSPGPHRYGFVVNGDGKVRRDPYEEKCDRTTDVARSVVIVK